MSVSSLKSTKDKTSLSETYKHYIVKYGKQLSSYAGLAEAQERWEVSFKTTPLIFLQPFQPPSLTLSHTPPPTSSSPFHHYNIFITFRKEQCRRMTSVLRCSESTHSSRKNTCRGGNRTKSKTALKRRLRAATCWNRRRVCRKPFHSPPWLPPRASSKDQRLMSRWRRGCCKELLTMGLRLMARVSIQMKRALLPTSSTTDFPSACHPRQRHQDLTSSRRSLRKWSIRERLLLN